VNLEMPGQLAARYHARTQQTRAVTEAWAEKNLYCPSCESKRLERSRANTPAIDFVCPSCASPYQLKSRSAPIGTRIQDAAYSAMRRAIEEDRTPNLLALHYERDPWRVCNLLLVPRFAFSLAMLERRPPLASHARRHGWVGCVIVLSAVPADARILIVSHGRAVSPAEVRRRYSLLGPLASLKPPERGWTLDVLNAVRRLGKQEFVLEEIYDSEAALAKLHPANRFIKPKIRQQLQVLRDLGILKFLSRGRYRLA
jgi:type II restriction enzyme